MNEFSLHPSLDEIFMALLAKSGTDYYPMGQGVASIGRGLVQQIIQNNF